MSAWTRSCDSVFAAYQLQSSLDICDALSDDWSRSSCYGEVFMENVSNSANEKKNFSPTDYHAPCNQLADQYRRECYIMQTSRMMEMGLSMERMLQECAKAGAYRVPCAQSIGRDLSNEARMGESRRRAKVRVGRGRQSPSLYARCCLCPG